MDPDHLKQPSKHPSSNQRKHHHHHRPSTATSTTTTTTNTSSSNTVASSGDDNIVAVLKRRDKSSSSSSGRGNRSVKHNNLFESTKDENNSDNNVDTKINNTTTSRSALDGGIKVRSKQREVGKVKPIRIVPPSIVESIPGGGDNEDKIKFQNSLIKSTTTAWGEEEPCSDNQKQQRHRHHHNQPPQFEDEANVDFKSAETPEKMFINTSELGPNKYYSKSKSTSSSNEYGGGTVLPEKVTIIYEDEDVMSCENSTSDNNNKSSNNNNNNFETRADDDHEKEEKIISHDKRRYSRNEVCNRIDETTEEEAVEEMQQNPLRVSSAPQMQTSTNSAMSRSSSSSCSERVKVIVRCRPMSSREVDQGYECVVNVNLDSCEIEVKRPQSATSTHSLYSNSGNVPELKVFAFDSVFDQRIPQKRLYDDAFRPLVDSVLEGYNGTIFAYGQTGTGKTFTMEGVREKEDQHGVIPNAFKHIFSHVVENPNRQYLIRASYLEIYQEEIRDLLSKDRKQHRELKESPNSGVYVKELSTYLCSNFSEINDLMTRGNKNRAVGATNMNEHSSRSHAIFQITIEVSEQWPDGQNHFKIGKLNLVDLAGSERQGKTGAVGERLKEATKINLSLSALGNVIAALVDGKSTHIPYRDSKLTRLLQDSLGGNSHTIMVATVGPASFNWEETITTLRYASRAKKIKNKPKVNEDPKDAMLRQYQEEIERLRLELEKKKAKQAEMLQRSQQESSSGSRAHTGRTRSSRAHTASSTASDSSSSASDQLRQIEEQRLKELASLLAPYGVDPSADPQDIMSQLDDRRKELLNDSKTLKEEKDKLLKRLDETQSLVKNTAEECKKLSEKIQWLESKVLTGGKSLVDHTNEQQKLIQAKQQELAEQTERYEEMRRKLQENELTTTELRSNAESLEAELHTKTKKLKKLSQKLYFSKEELASASDEHVNTMKELENVLMELKKEFSLKRMIIDNFIPYQSRKMIESRIVWDKQMEEYKLASLNSNFVLQRPPINRMTKTPLYSLSETGAVHMVDNVHYLDENILQLHPELPKRRTKDYVPPSRDPYITSLIKRAVEDAEKEVSVDCRNLGRKRTKTAKIPQKNSDYFKMGENLVCRRVKSAKPVSRSGSGLQHVQFRDFVVVSNFHKHFSPGNFGHASVLRGSGSSDY